jgi:hypothetical protein
MNLEKLYSLISRLFFVSAFVLLALAALERVANLMNLTFLRGTYTAGRLLEFSAILAIFVVVLLLRQIRELLKKK